jgi:hypothetical protein
MKNAGKGVINILHFNREEKFNKEEKSISQNSTKIFQELKKCNPSLNYNTIKKLAKREEGYELAKSILLIRAKSVEKVLILKKFLI